MMWQHRGQRRPSFAIEPGPDQESVWDYPRPPVVRPDARSVRVLANGLLIAETRSALRVLETASPPTFYLRARDVDRSVLSVTSATSYCEWKGRARYFSLATDPSGTPVAWQYPQPSAAFSALADCYAFYPSRVACFVDGERVKPQPGGFYGGWVTSDIVGPVKGERGTGHW